MSAFINDLLGHSNNDSPIVIEHGTDEFSPKVWQAAPKQFDVNRKPNNEPIDEDKGGSWWSWS